MIALRYAFFAVITIALNLFSQHVVFSLPLPHFKIYLAIIVGTGVGLVVKYYLDKEYIFYHKQTGLKHHAKKFTLYGLTGVFTTLIFWLFELGFHFLFTGSAAKYIGAVIGLTIGYCIKYFMDKRFVFRKIDEAS